MTFKSALRELNNAVLDLQTADYNTFQRPLNRLAAILVSDDLKPITEKLKAGVDFDSFLLTVLLRIELIIPLKAPSFSMAANKHCRTLNQGRFKLPYCFNHFMDFIRF